MAGASARRPKSNYKTNKGEWYHSKNNAVVWKEHQPAHRQRMKRGHGGQIKGRKAHIQAMPSSKKKWDVENEDLETHSRRKS